MTEHELRLLRSIGDALRAIHQDIHAIYEQQRSEGDEEQPPTQVDIQSVIRLPPPIRDYYESEQRERPGNTRRDSIRLVFEGIALSAAILAGIFAYRSFRELQKQTPAVIKSANAAKDASDTASDSLKQNTAAFRIDQRPYLVSSMAVFSETPTADKEIKVNITIKNIGKTPAIKVSTQLTLKPFHGSKTDRERYPAFLNAAFAELRDKNAAYRKEIESKHLEHDVAPGGDYFSTNQNSVVIAAKDFPLTVTGEITLMYIGIVTYTDAFMGDYVTEFCYQYWGTDARTWHICDSNNSIR